MSFVRRNRLALVLCGFLLDSLLSAQFSYEPRKYKDIEAELTVQVASQTAERGLGAATLTLTVTGPDSLEVEDPHLGDAAAAWKEERLTSTTMVWNKRAMWSQVIHLKQSKKGIETLPDVSLRFRDGPGAKWEEAKWIDILKRIRDLPAPTTAEERTSWLRRWGFVLALAAALLAVLVWLRRRRRRRRDAPLPPDQWALREIQLIETTLMPPAGEAEAFHTRMSFVVRRYVAERFGVQALQQTTTEVLEAVRQVPQPVEQQQALFSELFKRCDLAKFSGVPSPPEECRRTAELAREMVRQTTNG